MSQFNELAEMITLYGGFKTGEFILTSGRTSNVYCDLRSCLTNSGFLQFIERKMRGHLHFPGKWDIEDLIAAIPTSGLLLLGALLHNNPGCCNGIYVRTDVRTHGTKQQIEGKFSIGQNVILIDDVATSGGSLETACKCLFENDLKVKCCLVIVDRNEGAQERLAEIDVPLYWMITLQELRDYVSPTKSF